MKPAKGEEERPGGGSRLLPAEYHFFRSRKFSLFRSSTTEDACPFKRIDAGDPEGEGTRRRCGPRAFPFLRDSSVAETQRVASRPVVCQTRRKIPFRVAWSPFQLSPLLSIGNDSDAWQGGNRRRLRGLRDNVLSSSVDSTRRRGGRRYTTRR